jgi:hypothetical protein
MYTRCARVPESYIRKRAAAAWRCPNPIRSRWDGTEKAGIADAGRVGECQPRRGSSWSHRRRPSATRRPRRMRCEREAARPKRRCGLGSKGGKDPPRNLIRVDPSGKGGVTQPAMRPERTTKDAPPSSLQGILEKPEGVYDPLPGALQISSPQRRPPSFVSPARRASEPIVPPAARR